MRYDIAIIGSGPAGLSAAVNAKIRNKSFIIFGNKSLSTKIEKAPSIDNYLGLYNISGANLKQHFMDHIESMDIQIDEHKITNVYSMGDYFALASGSEMFEATTVIIAIGLDSAKSIEGEDTFLGRGVSYCATCDANFFEDFEVYVVGGGDSAVEEAMYLTKFARKVTIIHRRDELRAAKSIQEKAFKNPKLHFMWDTVVEEVGGDDILQWMKVKNVKTGEVTTVEADEEDGMFGVFGFIGTVPNTKPFEGIIDMDERGYIKTDADMHTNIPGVYAAGDVRVKSLRQVVTAAADGAIAAVQVERSMSDYF